MKLIFKGKFKSYDELPKGNLPPNAVKFKEFKGFFMLNLMAVSVAFIIAYALVRIVVKCRMDIETEFRPFVLWGILIGLICILPHEIIHAAAMGRDKEVLLYFSLKHFLAFVITLSPMTKRRFFFMGSIPSVVLGWLPFAFAMIFPDLPASGLIAAVGCFNIVGGSGDLIRMLTAAVQVPKDGLIQFSGIDLYWFMPTLSD